MRLRSLRPFLSLCALLLVASALSLVPAASAATTVSRTAPLPRIAAGPYHTCALTSAGRSYCWGGAPPGDGTSTAPYLTPTATTMPSGKRFVSIVAGETHTCGLASDGSAWCWGLNTYGQVGSPNDPMVGEMVALPREVSGGHVFVQLVAGQFHTCGLEGDGDAFCWGANGYGQLGVGVDDTTNRAAPTSVAGGLVFTQLGGGPTASTTCGLEAGGTAWCWGAGIEGQLGNYQMSYATVPDEVLAGINAPITDLVQVSVGSVHTCALDASGDVWCWGDNFDGQFGNGTSSYEGSLVADLVLDATALDASKTFVQLAVAGRDTCGVSRDGGVRCWGDNASGQLGNGTTTSSNVPVSVSGLGSATQVALGGYHACAFLADGGLSCWGENSYSALGDGTDTDRLTPISVTLAKAGQFTHIASGPYAASSCGLDDRGAAWCWGWNNNGEIGDGTTTYRYAPTAVTMPSGKRFVQLTNGWHHTCGLASDGTVWCWGDNAMGQIGDGTLTDRLVPTAVTMPATPTGATFVQISAGSEHTCGITSVGAAWCWGFNLWGQLGDGTSTDRSVPTAVSGGKTFTRIGSGRIHACALAVDGSAWCWGAGVYGNIGNGDTVKKSVPTAVSGSTLFADLAVGTDHACGLTSAGAAWCWGSNYSGGLGDGTTTDRSAPTSVTGGKVFTEVSAGQAHTCGRTADGVIWCWGSNETGQIGDGTSTNRTAPTSVTMPSGVTFARVAAGRSHVCALAGDGTLWCWGWGVSGQLGLGTEVSSIRVPTQLTSVTVTLNGTGVGTVTSSPAGISCPPTCSAPFPRGITVTLSAAVSAPSTFGGWSGSGCSGTGTCVVTTSQVRRVAALFTQPPTITSFTPTSAGKGAAVTVTGTNFMPGATCKINGVTVPICAYIDATTIVTAVPAGVATGKITVTTAGGPVTSTGNLTVLTSSAAPTITQVSPTAGIVGQEVIIQGTNVGAATAVKVNATTATSVSVIAANAVKILVPGGATTGKITVTTAGGSVISSTTFTVHLPPTIASFSPTSATDGVTVTISGTNFTGTTAVTFNGVAATSFKVVSPTSITATVPRGTTAGGIRVTNPAGAVTSAATFTPVRYTATQVTAGSAHSCVRTNVGTVRCWGLNTDGQLGDGTTTSSSVSVPVSGLSAVSSVSAGAAFTCAVVSAGPTGKVRCWGSNGNRQLGDGTTTSRSAPATWVKDASGADLTGVVQITTGSWHACALMNGGTVKCWGLNSSGQLGNGLTTTPTSAVTVLPIAGPGALAGVVQVSAGTNFTCARLASGGVVCWGQNSSGQLGDNSLVTRYRPVQVTGLTSDITTIAAGGAHACATRYEVEGEYYLYRTYCWGLNTYGQLGNGTTTTSKVPVNVVHSNGSSVVSGIAIAAGDAFTCVMSTGTLVACWGLNTSGQMGRNNTTSPQLYDRPVLAVTGTEQLMGATAIDAGATHMVALVSGAGLSWGGNASGRLGDGTVLNRMLPVYILGF